MLTNKNWKGIKDQASALRELMGQSNRDSAQQAGGPRGVPVCPKNVISHFLLLCRGLCCGCISPLLGGLRADMSQHGAGHVVPAESLLSSSL